MDIKWDNKFSVGHERIDHEHQVFLDLIKNVSIAAEEGMPQDKLHRLLIEIKKYADFHFYSEENIMIDCQYPDYLVHKEEHSVLLHNFDYQMNNYLSGIETLEELVEFLFEWFALHTTGSDKKLVSFISQKKEL